MNIIHQVYGSLKWKKSDTYSCAKLGISLEDYQEIKAKILVAKNDLEDEIDEYLLGAIEDKLSEIPPSDALVNAAQAYKNKVVEFKENLEEGTAEIKGIAVTEPKSPEEIIRLLKIDENKWKLSSYWNKQHKDYWLISAMVTKVKAEAQDLIAETLKNFSPKYTPVKQVHINDKYEAVVAGVLSIQDLHFGKEGNHSVIQDFKDAVVNLTLRAYHSHRVQKMIYVFGGDLLNMDTFDGSTTKGTPVDNDMRAQDAYNQAFDTLYWSINHISQFCNELEVVYLPGNHDRLSSYHLAHALSKCFNNPAITFHVDYAERKVLTWGENFFAFEHGDVSSKNTPLVYATEFSHQWGHTKYRTCYTGHWHRKKTMEYVTEDEQHGFAIKQLPSLSRSDYWHYHNKFVGAKRQAVLELHDLEKGKVCELTYNA
jgi:hypothetical protein